VAFNHIAKHPEIAGDGLLAGRPFPGEETAHGIDIGLIDGNPVLD